MWNHGSQWEPFWTSDLWVYAVLSEELRHFLKHIPLHVITSLDTSAGNGVSVKRNCITAPKVCYSGREQSDLLVFYYILLVAKPGDPLYLSRLNTSPPALPLLVTARPVSGGCCSRFASSIDATVIYCTA